jgi:NAD(P)-dependent dehydrogenase (short-subunit alcohol dehydrogenase family)
VRKSPFDLSGTVALVTGGNHGIGLAGAAAFAGAGADVAIWGRRAEVNEQAAASLRALGVRVWTDALDVAVPQDVERGFERACAELGRVDTVFVNAGVFHQAASFAELAFDDYRALLRVNLDGAFLTMRHAVAHMCARAEAGDPGGSIIVNGSLSVTHGVPGMEHYGAAKGGLAAMVKGVAVEYGGAGIRVNMICPGFIRRDWAGRPPGISPFEEMMKERCPIPRIGEPEDLGGILVYLASDASCYHTGDVITIDGGWTAKTL